MIRLPAAALLLFASATIAGCGADPYPTEDPQALHLFLLAEMKGFDPAHVNEEISTANVLNLYETLYEYHYLKRPFELKPCLAEAMPEVSEDQRTYRIRVKRGVRFSDDPCFPGGKGREMTAEDVVFCLKRILDARVMSEGDWVLADVKGWAEFKKSTEGGAKHRTAYPDFEGIRAVDRQTLEIVLEKPAQWFPWILAMAYTSVYAPEAVGYYREEFLNHAVGTGPYVVKEFDRAQRVVLERNPNYREDYYPSEGSEEDRARGRLDDAGKRLPLSDRVVATVFREMQPMWLFFQQGYLDRAQIPKDSFDVAIDPTTRELRGEMAERGITLDKTPRLEIVYEAFNMEDPVLGAPNGERGRAIRRAMSIAYDDEWAAEHLYNFRVERVDGPLLQEFPEYVPGYRNEWKRREGESREAALDRARRILSEVGYPGGQGIPPLVYDHQEDVTSRQFFEAFRRDMADIGIEVRSNPVTWQELMKRTDNKQTQVWGQSWGADYPDAQNFLQLFYGPNSPSPNSSNYANDEYDKAYEDAIRLPPSPRRTELYRRMQEIVVEDCPWIFRFRRAYWNLSHAWLKNFVWNDIYPKFYKYCRVDAPLRDRRAQEWNRPTAIPVIAFVGAFVLLFGLTAVVVRRTATSW